MRNKESGLSVIILTVILAVSAIITAGAGVTTIQIMRGTERNVEHSESVQQAHSLGRWFSRDALASSNITAGDDASTGEEELASIYWGDWESGGYYCIRYIWLEDVPPLKKVIRNEAEYDREGSVIETNENLAAYGVYTANLTKQGDTWIFCVEARSGEKTSVQVFEIAPRLN